MSYDVGHKFWIVKSKWIEREKKTDENGIVWQRVYPSDREYYLIDAEVVGKITMEIEGHSLWDDEPFYNQYAVKTSDGYMESVSEDDLDGADWGVFSAFRSKEEAEKYANGRNNAS